MSENDFARMNTGSIQRENEEDIQVKALLSDDSGVGAGGLGGSGRRVVIYGDVNPRLTAILTGEYGVQLVMSHSRITESFLSLIVNQRDTYDVVLIASDAPKAKLFGQYLNRNGVRYEYVDATMTPVQAARFLAQKFGWKPRSRTVIVPILCAKGGTGKSTTTVGTSLQLRAVESGAKILVLGDDWGQAHTRQLFLVGNAPLLESFADPDAINHHIAFVRRYNLHFLFLADYPSRGSGGLPTKAVATAFWNHLLKMNFDYIIVDTHPGFPIPEVTTPQTPVYISHPLLRDPSLPTVPVVVLSPTRDQLGITGARAVLEKLHPDIAPWAIPAIVLTKADMSDGVSDAVNSLRFHQPHVLIPFDRRVAMGSQGIFKEGTFFAPAPRTNYNDLVQSIIRLAEKRRSQMSR